MKLTQVGFVVHHNHLWSLSSDNLITIIEIEVLGASSEIKVSVSASYDYAAIGVISGSSDARFFLPLIQLSLNSMHEKICSRKRLESRGQSPMETIHLASLLKPFQVVCLRVSWALCPTVVGKKSVMNECLISASEWLNWCWSTFAASHFTKLTQTGFAINDCEVQL